MKVFGYRHLLPSLLVGFVAARLGTDPDTKCQDMFRKTPTKEACLATEDHFFRPCEYCTTKAGDEPSCYNADEARWAKLFGEKCETAQVAGD